MCFWLQVGGVGVELLEDADGAVRCGDLQPGSPAETAGLQRGDTLACTFPAHTLLREMCGLWG
jgi:hypothetical protein